MQDRGAGRENFRGRVGITAAESEPWWPERPHAPEGSPNVVVIALDDTGFAHLGCFGFDIEMMIVRTPRQSRVSRPETP